LRTLRVIAEKIIETHVGGVLRTLCQTVARGTNFASAPPP